MKMKGKIFPSDIHVINMASGDTPEISHIPGQYQGDKHTDLTTKKARLIDSYEIQLKAKAWEAAIALREFEHNKELLFRVTDRLRKLKESLQKWKIVGLNYELSASVLGVGDAENLITCFESG